MEINKQDNILEFRNIRKTFPGVMALDDVSFSIRRGEVHGLVGENGAGKSTLIKILSGVYTADSGDIVVNGKKTHIAGTAEAQREKVQVMHQEISVLPNMTVAENIFIHDMPRRCGFFTNTSRMNEKAREVLDAVGLFHVSPRQMMSELSLAAQQMVNLSRIVSTKPHVVLLDEPTASLTMNEMDRLFETIEGFKKTGVSMVYVSHYIEEVLKISDRVSVLRDGKFVKTCDSRSTTREELITAMIGKKLEIVRRSPLTEPENVLELKDVTGSAIIKHVDLELKRREVLGLYGLNGAGKTETLRAITGADKIVSGQIRLFGADVTQGGVSGSLDKGLVYVPEDRRRQGLVLGMNVRENTALGNEKKYSLLNFISRKRERTDVSGYIEKMRVKTPGVETQVNVLSGGNQQKVIMARCMARASKVFVLDEPTVGIDVGAREEIYQLISELVKEGASVLIASSDLAEILQMCDRIAVIAHGSIAAVLDREAATQENLLFYATGEKENAS